ncbi:hypothetical protein KSS87_017643 [Heliosperma pusillum]|nr:hypothetical protein KSS87_017643 [Heliosperma pusillum]
MSSTALCTVSFGVASPVKLEKTAMFSLSLCTCSSTQLKTLNFPLSSKLSQLGSSHFTPWNGLRYMGISISPKPHKNGRRAKYRGKGVYASLFGVGAPEALVIGVVALLVFGPKGLAEVARNLGKTLRAFQPTIRELQDVSKEFKSTLEREIGLDDDPRPMRNPYQSATPPKPIPVEDFENVPLADPNGTPTSKAYTSEEYLKITEEQLKASGAVQPDVMPSSQENQIESINQPDTPPTIASAPPESSSEPESQPQASQVDDMPSRPESKIESESQTEGGNVERLEYTWTRGQHGLGQTWAGLGKGARSHTAAKGLGVGVVRAGELVALNRPAWENVQNRCGPVWAGEYGACPGPVLGTGWAGQHSGVEGMRPDGPGRPALLSSFRL